MGNLQHKVSILQKEWLTHNGMTLGLSKLKEGDDLLIGDAWDSFSYKGQGTYIAGGSGITPFIAILRDLNTKGGTNDQTLLFANKSRKDIFLKDELSELKGLRFVNILSEEKG